MLPIVAWERFLPSFLPRARERLGYWLLNRLVTWKLQPCDILVCMSGIYLEAAKFAKAHYGARIWLERGSRHILSQRDILASVPGAALPTALTIKRELAGYELADCIVVASTHVAESFARDPRASAKLFRNPYGVDLAMFPLRGEKLPSDPVSLVFAGTWSLRKGCDLLASAVKQLDGVRLTYVGSIGDLKFPDDDARFVHLRPVPQPSLAAIYAMANILVLASREDGFGVVLSQALTTGLPVICTDRTGGAELRYSRALTERITIVPAGDAQALAEAIASWRDKLLAGHPLTPLTESDREMLSWTGYGWRHSEGMLRDLARESAT